MKSRILFLLAVCLSVSGLLSCSNEDENKMMTVTIASVKRIYDGDYQFSPYYAKESATEQWTPFDYIEGFDHQEGHEYVLQIWREKWHNGEIMDASMYRYKLIKALSVTVKESEGELAQALEVTIASRKSDDPNLPLLAKLPSSIQWEAFPAIEGFQYEVGTEYSLFVKRIYNGSKATPKYSYSYIETFRKIQKDSE